ncbi:MAG: septum formation protein Maf [Anaerolineales bacterium]|nr:septum formation protein Maf [Anaerolineales bacterium]
MDSPKLVLASTSPRRKELLSLLGLPFEVMPADINEDVLPGEAPTEYVMRLARGKAQVIAERLDGVAAVVIAADTTVVHEGEIIGKPLDAADAERILRRLRGRIHQVYSGLCLWDTAAGRQVTDLALSQVPMRNYSDSEMSAYIASGQPLDKAGAYGIQNTSFHPVENFAGCFANVAGLPLCHLLRNWRRWGLPLAVDLPAACQQHLNYDCPVSHLVLQWEH